MSIERDGKDYSVVCDICLEVGYTTDDFNDAVDYKKAYGWKSRKENGEWVDICNSCQLLED